MPTASKRSRNVAFEDEIDTPTPSDFTSEAQSPEPAKKRSRKPWGQPVEPFEKVIGPRKRAKTDQEKDQRAKERILRNRKAADASRQRRKDEQDRLQRRIAELEADLEVYHNKFGPLPKHESSITQDYDNNDIPQYQPHISPELLSQPNQPETFHGAVFDPTPPASTPGDAAFDTFQQQPAIKQEQTLTTTLPIDNTTYTHVPEASYIAEAVMTHQSSSFFDVPNFHFPAPTASDLDDLHQIMSFNAVEDADQVDYFPGGFDFNPQAANGDLQDLDDPVFAHPATLDFDQFLHDEADVPHQAPEPTAQPQPVFGAVS